MWKRFWERYKAAAPPEKSHQVFARENRGLDVVNDIPTTTDNQVNLWEEDKTRKGLIPVSGHVTRDRLPQLRSYGVVQTREEIEPGLCLAVQNGGNIVVHLVPF